MKDTTAEATIPVIYIDVADDWSVDDVQTMEDCNEAMAYLTEAIAAIEAKIERLKASRHPDPDEFIPARCALRWKKEAKRLVHEKINKLRSERVRASKAAEKEDAIAKRAEKARRHAAHLEVQRNAKIERDRTARLIMAFVRDHHPEIYQQALEFAESNPAPKARA